jgi:hypothetical protein
VLLPHGTTYEMPWLRVTDFFVDSA